MADEQKERYYTTDTNEQYLVTCLMEHPQRDDTVWLERVLSTRTVFETREAAEHYLLGIAQERLPEIVRAAWPIPMDSLRPNEIAAAIVPFAEHYQEG